MNKEATAAVKGMGGCLPEQCVGLSLPMQHFRSRAATKGTKRVHVKAGNQRVRRPLTRELLRMKAEEHRRMREWKGRRAWTGLAFSYQLATRASGSVCQGGRESAPGNCCRSWDIVVSKKGMQLGPDGLDCGYLVPHLARYNSYRSICATAATALLQHHRYWSVA